MFHYFAVDQENIEAISDMYWEHKENVHDEGSIDIRMPLLILSPNTNNATAIGIAIKQMRPKCLELMVEMLSEFNSVPITKMLVPVMTKLLSSPSEKIINFFGEAVFQPVLMQKPNVVPWT